ncbi:hypothetical protein CHS0354_027102, partial [Potamilus streckersoni]
MLNVYNLENVKHVEVGIECRVLADVKCLFKPTTTNKTTTHPNTTNNTTAHPNPSGIGEQKTMLNSD